MIFVNLKRASKGLSLVPHLSSVWWGPAGNFDSDGAGCRSRSQLLKKKFGFKSESKL